MSWFDVLKLGRVSNLPTVWTNGLAGLVLGGGTLLDPRTLPMLLTFSLFYVAGMYLNDAFDAEIDRKERPDRPIPSGAVDLRTVFACGVVMITIGLCLLVWIGFVAPGGTGGWPALAGLVLVTSIVVYDWDHKENPFSPYIMGVCRMLVYLTAGLCFLVPPTQEVLLAAVILFSYLIGLTMIAKQERAAEPDRLKPGMLLAPPLLYGFYVMVVETSVTIIVVVLALIAVVAIAIWMVSRRLPDDVGVAVAVLIAGICLLDAMFLVGAGELVLAWWAIAAFVLTLVLQKIVPGT